MKTNLTISIDYEVLQEARLLKIPLSKIINDYLKEYLAIKRAEKKNPEAEIARIKAILDQKELELEQQKRLNVKDLVKMRNEGKVIEL